MQVTKKSFIVLELNEEECRWIKRVSQNCLLQSPTEETSSERDIRVSLFHACGGSEEFFDDVVPF